MDKDRLIDETLEQLDACERGPEGWEWRDRDAAAKVLEAFAATLLEPYREALSRLVDEYTGDRYWDACAKDIQAILDGKSPTGEGA